MTSETTSPLNRSLLSPASTESIKSNKAVKILKNDITCGWYPIIDATRGVLTQRLETRRDFGRSDRTFRILVTRSGAGQDVHRGVSGRGGVQGFIVVVDVGKDVISQNVVVVASVD